MTQKKNFICVDGIKEPLKAIWFGKAEYDLQFREKVQEHNEILESICPQMTQKEYDELVAKIKKDWITHCYERDCNIRRGWLKTEGYVEFIKKMGKEYKDFSNEVNKRAKAIGLKVKEIGPKAKTGRVA